MNYDCHIGCSNWMWTWFAHKAWFVFLLARTQDGPFGTLFWTLREEPSAMYNWCSIVPPWRIGLALPETWPNWHWDPCRSFLTWCSWRNIISYTPITATVTTTLQIRNEKTTETSRKTMLSEISCKVKDCRHWMFCCSQILEYGCPLIVKGGRTCFHLFIEQLKPSSIDAVMVYLIAWRSQEPRASCSPL